jgi:quercetin dioxygenase-like cupin family protein
MIRSGQTIENPVTGEVLVFHKTSRDTDGEYVLVETILRPGATVAAAHSHPYQSETFHVLEAASASRSAARRSSFGPGTA